MGNESSQEFSDDVFAPLSVYVEEELQRVQGAMPSTADLKNLTFLDPATRATITRFLHEARSAGHDVYLLPSFNELSDQLERATTHMRGTADMQLATTLEHVRQRLQAAREDARKRLLQTVRLGCRNAEVKGHAATGFMDERWQELMKLARRAGLAVTPTTKGVVHVAPAHRPPAPPKPTHGAEASYAARVKTLPTAGPMDCPCCWHRKICQGCGGRCTHCGGSGTVFDLWLSPHFRLSQLLGEREAPHSPSTARQNGLPNVPGDVELARLHRVCMEILEPTQRVFGTLVIHSGYRAPKVNSHTKNASPTSVHQLAWAADFHAAGASVTKVIDWLIAQQKEKRIRYDQVIHEKTWVHVGLFGPSGSQQGSHLVTTDYVHYETYRPQQTEFTLIDAVAPEWPDVTPTQVEKRSKAHKTIVPTHGKHHPNNHKTFSTDDTRDATLEPAGSTLAEMAMSIIKYWEGYRADAYQDQHGKWTIGWGTTGPDVHQGLHWDQAYADRRLATHVQADIVSVQSQIKPRSPLPLKSMAALVDFHYNLGSGHFRESNLLKHINNWELEKTLGDEGFLGWCKDGPGIRRRRVVETRIWKEGLVAAGLLPNTATAIPTKSSDAVPVQPRNAHSDATHHHDEHYRQVSLHKNPRDPKSWGLEPAAEEGARLLLDQFSFLRISSGLRTPAEQASAMAGNVIGTTVRHCSSCGSKHDGRYFIRCTYRESPLKHKLQKWVDEHPRERLDRSTTTQAFCDVFAATPIHEVKAYSNHMSGMCIDLEPVLSRKHEVFAAVAKLPRVNPSQVFSQEAGKDIWHVGFK